MKPNWIGALAGAVLFAIAVGHAQTESASPVGTLVAGSDAEQRLWNRALEEQQVIDRSGFVFNDGALDDYLTGIVDRLIESDGFPPGTFRVSAIKDASLNAFAFPHGRIYVHTGLLARMHNEAQIAAVLAHEVTHPIHRHTWRQLRDLKSKTAWMAGTTALSGGATALLSGLATVASVSGYSRAMETEADNLGFIRLVSAGYDTSEAHAAFQLLLEDLRRDRRKEPFFFGSHPKLAERHANYLRLHATRPNHAAGEKGAERFAEQMREVLVVNAELEMRAGRFDAARDQLRRRAAMPPDNVRVFWLLGETERLAGAHGNADEARRYLEQALALDHRFVAAHRSLGLLHYRAGAWCDAAPHFLRVLELEPEATDRAYLETYLQKCESRNTPSPPPPSS